MNLLKDIRKWLGTFSKLFSWAMPIKLKLIFQAIRVGLDAFILVYKNVRKMQANKMRREIKESAEKIKDPRLTLEERLQLNAEMESHFKHFVSGTNDK